MMKSTICVIMLFLSISLADILQLERWPIMETISHDVLDGVFAELKKSTFPDYRQEFSGFIMNRTMIIKEFKLTSLVPRYKFIKPTFYENHPDTFSINMPLGFHITAEFVWVCNAFILPITGAAKIDTDIHDLQYNTTMIYTGLDGNVNVRSNLTYKTIKAHEVEVSNSILYSWVEANTLLLHMMDKYYGLMHTYINSLFEKTMPGILMKYLPGILKVTLYYPTFHIVKQLDLPLKGVTTRNALLLTYGATTGLPDNVVASDSVSRQYCIDQGLLNTVVTEIWKDMRGVYHNEDLPKNSIYQLTVLGLSELVPDVLIEYPKDAVVTLVLTTAQDRPADIKLEKLNSTHGLAKNFRMLLDYRIGSTSILKVTLQFDIIIEPIAERRGTGFDFDLKTLQASVQKNSILVKTDYKTVILSNIQASSTDFLTYLILPFLGHTLLGDGVWISDSITAHCIPEYSIASAAVCLNLVKIS